jgi:hypothetical protein
MLESILGTGERRRMISLFSFPFQREGKRKKK